MMSFKLSIGRVAFADRELFTNEAICALDDLKANAEFLYHALPRVDFSLYGKQAVKGHTLNQGALRSIVVSLPAPTEQAAIAEVLADMDADIEATETKLAKARSIKQGMMQELLTGRIRYYEAQRSPLRG
jgi:type I restriction enzyme S subunit